MRVSQYTRNLIQMRRNKLSDFWINMFAMIVQKEKKMALNMRNFKSQKIVILT